MNQAQAILFDLSNVASVSAVTHKCAVITDADGNPLSGFVMVGKNSNEYRNIQRDIRVENLQRSAKRQKDVDTTTPEGAEVVINTVEQNDLRTACAVVVGWFGFGANGQEVPFDKSMLPGIFTSAPTWKDKILTDLEKEGNFMPVSSKG